MKPAELTGDNSTDRVTVDRVDEHVWEVVTPVGRFIAPDEAGARWLKQQLEGDKETSTGGW